MADLIWPAGASVRRLAAVAALSVAGIGFLGAVLLFSTNLAEPAAWGIVCKRGSLRSPPEQLRRRTPDAIGS